MFYIFDGTILRIQIHKIRFCENVFKIFKVIRKSFRMTFLHMLVIAFTKQNRHARFYR